MSAMPKTVAEAVNAVMGKVKHVDKSGENKFHNYKYARVEDLMAKVQPAMFDAGLVIVQSEVERQLIGEGALMVATYEFALAHKSGEVWDERIRHTGMAAARNSKGGFDDKALNKCHTAARKYFIIGLLQVPTGDLPDVDAEEDKPALREAPQSVRKSAAQAKRDLDHEKLIAAIKACRSEAELDAWYRDFDRHTAHVPFSWLDPMRDEIEKHRNDLLEKEAA